MGLPCSVPELPHPPAGLRCGFEGYLSKDVGALLVNLTGIVTYSECANHCATRVEKCRSFGYSSAARVCSLYANTLTAQGLKKKTGSGTKFWNRKCFGRCTCPSNSTWDGGQCNCNAPYTEDFYGGVCACPLIGQSLSADGKHCVCPNNQAAIYINVTEPDTPRQPNTGTGTRKEACGCQAPSFLQSNGTCTCPGSATYEIYPDQLGHCSCPNNQDFITEKNDCGCANGYNLSADGICVCPDDSYVMNGLCQCRAQSATRKEDGSCGCPAPLTLSADYRQCQCPKNQQLDPDTNTCGCSDVQVQQPDGTCACKAQGATSYNDGSCTCPYTFILSDDKTQCECPQNLELISELNECGCSGTQVLGQDGTCLDGVACPDTSVRVTGGQCQCDDGTSLIPDNPNSYCPCPGGLSRGCDSNGQNCSCGCFNGFAVDPDNSLNCICPDGTHEVNDRPGSSCQPD